MPQPGFRCQGIAHPIFSYWPFHFSPLSSLSWWCVKIFSTTMAQWCIGWTCWHGFQTWWHSYCDFYITCGSRLWYSCVLPLHCGMANRHSNLQHSLGHLDRVVLSPRKDWKNWHLTRKWEPLLVCLLSVFQHPEHCCVMHVFCRIKMKLSLWVSLKWPDGLSS